MAKRKSISAARSANHLDMNRIERAGQRAVICMAIILAAAVIYCLGRW